MCYQANQSAVEGVVREIEVIAANLLSDVTCMVCYVSRWKLEKAVMHIHEALDIWKRSLRNVVDI